MLDGVSIVALAGVAAALLSLVDAVPYLRDIRRGRTRPHRVTWFIWTVLGVVAFVSQLADGATWSLWMFGGQALSMAAIFALSIRSGEGGLAANNVAMLGLAIAGVIGWYLSSEPIVATCFVILADAVGFGLMLPKTWLDPWSETRSTYLLATISGALSTVAVGGLDASLLLYPVYSACTDGLTTVVITMRRRSMAQQVRRGYGVCSFSFFWVDAANRPKDVYPGQERFLDEVLSRL